MIGTYYSRESQEASNKPPLKLHNNFYRAIAEAEEAVNGKAIIVNSKFALIKPHSDDFRLLVTKD